nr:reverse transcriptase domain-containing protein [Tanacetum cinerariifolium]
MAPTVEVVLTNGTLLLAETVLEAETAPMALKNRRSSSMKRGRNGESPLSRVSESGTSEGGQWKSKSKRRKPTDEEDLTPPGHVKRWIRSHLESGAPECMRISGFMHGVNNPELTKRLNEHVPKTVEEMMIATAAFIWG